MLPALPLSDGSSNEDHDERSIKGTLQYKADEYRCRKADSHVFRLGPGQGVGDEGKEEIEMSDAAVGFVGLLKQTT